MVTMKMGFCDTCSIGKGGYSLKNILDATYKHVKEKPFPSIFARIAITTWDQKGALKIMLAERIHSVHSKKSSIKF